MAAPTLKETLSDRLPSEIESRGAQQLEKIVTSQIADDGSTKLSLATRDGKAEPVTLAPALTASLLEILKLVSSGCGFRMIPINAELTTQQAADLLNVPRPYIIKLLDDGEIPYVKSRRHRRIRANDLFDYKKKRDEVRSAALDDLMRRDAEMGLI